MHIVSVRSCFALAFALAALGLGAKAAHAQSASLPSWTSGWQSGLTGGAAAAPSANPYAGLLAFGGGDIASGNFSSRYNFDNGWFVGSERGASGFGVNGFGPAGAWGNLGSLSYDSTRFGYNFANAPVSVFAGFSTLKYNNGIGNPLAGFDSTSSAASGYGVHAGVEIRPTANLSLSVGASFTQPPTGIDGGFNSVPGATSFAFGRR
jgi:opacity protein-like surface antigen